MFRGVNVLRFDQDGNKQNYGSSLYWTQLNVSFMPTGENDTITLGSWMAFGLSRTNYKEFNATANYVHAFGDLSVGVGYTFYYYLASVLYQNELNATVAYTFNLPAGITSGPLGDLLISTLALTLTISSAEQARWRPLRATFSPASTATIPIYKDIVALAPWVAFGTSFDYNASGCGQRERFRVFHRRQQRTRSVSGCRSRSMR